MQHARPVGRAASSRKYDLITALGAHACGGDKHLQRLILRLITLIVARYNWQSDEIAVGQREIARLWSVDERTVKRDIARLRAMGWLVQRRAAARGRVAVHGLDIPAILAATAPDWPAVGPDFVERMAGPAPTPPAGNVISFPPAPTGDGVWPRALARLHAEDPALCAAWFRQLAEVGQAGDLLELAAPNRFHARFVLTHHLARLTEAVRREDASLRHVVISGD
ncbi:MAG: hypothetical protein H5U19_13440 [Rhodobacteraceae bacterium]|nr:hypothetical protein [Paracoccaceae bacterium]